METNTIYEIPLEQIDCPTITIRDIDGATINDLRESIENFGVLQPILVRYKTESKRYEIVFGNHRFYAAKGAGLTTIPAKIMELSDSKALLLSVTENIQRLEMDPAKEGEIYTKLLTYYDYKALSKRLGKSIPYLRGRVSIHKKLHPDLKSKVGKELTISQATQIGKLPLSKQKTVFEMIQQTRNSLEQKFKETVKPYGGAVSSWSPYCKCPKCGSIHEKGADYKNHEKS